MTIDDKTYVYRNINSFYPDIGCCVMRDFFEAEYSPGRYFDMKEPTQEKVVYVKAERCSIVSARSVRIEDIAEVFSNDKKLAKRIKQEVLLKIQENKPEKIVFSILRLFEVLDAKYKNIEWVNAGEDEFIVSYQPPKKLHVILEVVKTVFVCLAVFFGAAFTIMTFNQDVAVGDVFRMMEELVIGNGVESKVIEIAYSIGLPVGIILFFNHFSRLKIDSDPTPLQVQLRLYEENVNKTVIENASREGKMQESQ